MPYISVTTWSHPSTATFTVSLSHTQPHTHTHTHTEAAHLSNGESGEVLHGGCEENFNSLLPVLLGTATLHSQCSAEVIGFTYPMGPHVR